MVGGHVAAEHVILIELDGARELLLLFNLAIKVRWHPLLANGLLIKIENIDLLGLRQVTGGVIRFADIGVSSG